MPATAPLRIRLRWDQVTCKPSLYGFTRNLKRGERYISFQDGIRSDLNPRFINRLAAYDVASVMHVARVQGGVFRRGAAREARRTGLPGRGVIQNHHSTRSIHESSPRDGMGIDPEGTRHAVLRSRFKC